MRARTQWVARDVNTGLALAVETMRRKAVDEGRKAGVEFNLERDGRIVSTYAGPAAAKPLVSASGTVMVSCPRCRRSVRPKPGTVEPGSHVKTGTRVLCRVPVVPTAARGSVKDQLADLTEDEQEDALNAGDPGPSSDDQRDAERDLRAVFDAEEANS